MVNENGIGLSEPDKPARLYFGLSQFSYYSYLRCSALFLGTFLLGVYYNFVARPNNVTLVFDSAHYYHSASLLKELLVSYPGSLTNATLLNELFAYISVDGPVLPFIGAVALFLFPHTSGVGDNWQALVVVQAIMHAFSACLVYLLVQKLTRSWGWGLVAACGFATYFAAMLAIGRFLTETFTATLLLLLTCFLFRSLEKMRQSAKQSIGHSLFAGFLIGTLVLIKTALVPALAVAEFTCFLSLPFWKQKCRWLLCLLVGLALPLIIWLAISTSVFHHGALFPERSAGLNVAAGVDLESDGWSTIPLTPFFELNYSEKPLPILYGVWQDHKAEFCGLMMRKLARLYAIPWNDFHRIVFGIGIEEQILFQRSLLLLACSGMFLFIVNRSGQNLAAIGQQESLIACLSIIFVLGHLIFLPFEAAPRYCYPATPFMFILAVSFLAALWKNGLFPKKRIALCLAALLFLVSGSVAPEPCLMLFGMTFKEAASTVFALRLVIAPVFLGVLAAFIASFEKTKQAKQALVLLSVLWLLALAGIAFLQYWSSVKAYEWQCGIDKSESVERVCALPSFKNDSLYWAAVLIDGDENIVEAEFKLNGQVLSNKPVPVWSIHNNYRYHQTLRHVIKTEAEAENVTLSRLRQWRLIKVPLTLIKPGEKNSLTVSVKGNNPAVIYGDYLDVSEELIRLPALHTISVPRCQNTVPSFDCRIKDPVLLSLAGSSCRASMNGLVSPADLSPSFGVQSGNYRLLLLVAHGFKGSAQEQLKADEMRFADCFVTLH